jgi:hypothetical protein
MKTLPARSTACNRIAEAHEKTSSEITFLLTRIAHSIKIGVRAILFSALIVILAGHARAVDTLEAMPVPLGPGQIPGTTVDKLRFMGGLRLDAKDRRFGGLSGLFVSGRLRVTAVSDRGYFIEFELVEDAKGALVSAHRLEITPMRDAAGNVLRNADRDAEDLAILPDGTRVVVFERNARLGWFDAGSPWQTYVASLLDLVPGSNEDIESLVALPDGRFLLIAEDLLVGELRPAWLGRPGQWERFDYLPEANEGVAGAALLPDGDLLVLERSAAVASGFRTRLRRVPADAIGAGALVSGETLVELAAPRIADNFEGVATRALADGRAAIYLVSDDNYFPLQRTYLLKFETLP